MNLKHNAFLYITIFSLLFGFTLGGMSWLLGDIMGNKLWIGVIFYGGMSFWLLGLMIAFVAISRIEASLYKIIELLENKKES